MSRSATPSLALARNDVRKYQIAKLSSDVSRASRPEDSVNLVYHELNWTHSSFCNSAMLAVAASEARIGDLQKIKSRACRIRFQPGRFDHDILLIIVGGRMNVC